MRTVCRASFENTETEKYCKQTWWEQKVDKERHNGFAV